MLKVRTIYYINADPEPFDDEEWFWHAKQHLSYDRNKLPEFQITMEGWPLSNHNGMIGDNRMADPSTMISILASLNGAKAIGLSAGTQILMAPNSRIYRLANYQDAGLNHYKEYTTRSIRRSIKDLRRFYLIPMSQALQSRLGPEIVAAAF